MARQTGDKIEQTNFANTDYTPYSVGMTMNNNVSSGGHYAMRVGPWCILVINKNYTGSSVGSSTWVTIGTVSVTPIAEARAVATKNYGGTSAMYDIKVTTAGAIQVLGAQSGTVVLGTIVYFSS